MADIKTVSWKHSQVKTDIFLNENMSFSEAVGLFVKSQSKSKNIFVNNLTAFN